MFRFAIIGAAGFIASRHLRAIKETGNTLIAAMDVNDSVGIIDSFFPDSDFFVEFERFDRHLEKLRRKGPDFTVDFITVCSPNYLHDAHIRFALRSGASVICEKPIVLNPWNIDALKEVESDSKGRILSVLQLRLHPRIINLKEKVKKSSNNHVFEVDLTYVTSRGKWYNYSWKGNQSKSGGLSTNIGVHLFDMLYFIFGKPKNIVLNFKDNSREAGFLEYENARVRWFLSINHSDLPEEIVAKGQRTYRMLTIDDEIIEFSDGFTDLHTKVYEEIFKGNGFGLDENRSAIETVSKLRNMTPSGLIGDFHKFLLNMNK